ncbi:MAG: type I-D CRISPR-associated helicase Cas3' [Candidatus Jordarchaeales archaeon]
MSSILVKGFELPYSNKKVGRLTLMEYQKEVLEKDEKVIIIDAPTGSGKTLAILKKAIESTDEGEIALFLYPTNELLNDQIESFKQLLSMMGYKYSSIEGNINDIDNSEIKLLPISGEHLDLLARGKTKGAFLREILNSWKIFNSKLFILSNIDFIFNMIKSSYLYSEFLYQDFYNSLQFIAVDELHLYNGIMFLSLLYSLKPVEKRVNSIVFSTATHLNNLNVLMKSLDSEKSIVKAEEGSGRIVRYDTKLEVTCFGDEAYLSTDEHAEKVLEKIEELLKESKNVLCIFNSVVFAEKISELIEKRIGEEVGRIHGFIPKSIRENMRNKRIIVGTNSIEVGVDFDVEGLIFEANTAPSFIQRFGRVGRHREGIAVAITPYYEYKNLKKLSNEVKYKELEEIVRKTMEMPDDLSSIKNTKTGIRLYLAFVASLISLLKRSYKSCISQNLKIKEIKEKISQLATSENLNPNIESTMIENELKELKNEKITWANTLLQLARVFPRGGVPIVVAYIKKYNTFEIIPIVYLEKAELTLRSSSEFSEKPPWLESLEEHEGEIPLFVVENITFSNNIEVLLSRRISINKLETLTENSFEIKSSWREEINRYLKEQLNGLPVILTYNKPNWRFSYLRARNPRDNKLCYLIIGGDALIWNELQNQK